MVTQVRHEGRWLITVAPDPCPQFVVHNLTKTTLAVAQPTNTETTVATVQVFRLIIKRLLIFVILLKTCLTK